MTVRNAPTIPDHPLSMKSSLPPSKPKHARNKSSDFDNNPILAQNLGLPFLGIPFKGEVIIGDMEEEPIGDGTDKESSNTNKKEVASLKRKDTLDQTNTFLRRVSPSTSALEGSTIKDLACRLRVDGEDVLTGHANTSPLEDQNKIPRPMTLPHLRVRLVLGACPMSRRMSTRDRAKRKRRL